MAANILVFAGTAEGRELCTYLVEHGVPVTASVATAEGEAALIAVRGLTIHTGRLDQAAMRSFIRPFSLIVDATHPYAEQVTKLIRQTAEEEGIEVWRLVRPSSSQEEGTVVVPTVQAAITYLQEQKGNIFLTVGSKELPDFAENTVVWSRCFARVLPTPQAMTLCKDLGLSGSQVVAMQGPFSTALNLALLKETKARFLVTKDSGEKGGFTQKQEAAKQIRATLVVIARPSQEEGLSLAQIKTGLARRLHFAPKTVYLLGAGPGTPALLTVQAQERLETAEVVLATSQRLVEQMQPVREDIQYSALSEVEERIFATPAEKIAVLVSGDISFFSLARTLRERLQDKVKLRSSNGISSLQYFCSRLGIGYEKIKTVSLHGRDRPYLGEIARYPLVFLLTGGTHKAEQICEELARNGLGAVQIAAGENLSMPSERILQGSAIRLAQEHFADLTVLLVQNGQASSLLPTLPDSAFIRGKVPMTKEEIRWLALAKLQILPTDVVYDIGAGTGSVSVCLARQAYKGRVYAVERGAEACALIHKNEQALQAYSLQVVAGEAPAALSSLPAPDKVFIGGSGGNLEAILKSVLQKNPQVRLVLPAVTLETLHQATTLFKKLGLAWQLEQVGIAKAEPMGDYHLLKAQNPIFILTAGRTK